MFRRSISKIIPCSAVQGGYIQHNPLCVPRNKKVGNFCPRQDLASVYEPAHEATIYIVCYLNFGHKAVTFFEAPTEKNELGFRKGGLDSRRPNFDD